MLICNDITVNFRNFHSKLNYNVGLHISLKWQNLRQTNTELSTFHFVSVPCLAVWAAAVCSNANQPVTHTCSTTLCTLWALHTTRGRRRQLATRLSLMHNRPRILLTPPPPPSRRRHLQEPVSRSAIWQLSLKVWAATLVQRLEEVNLINWFE